MSLTTLSVATSGLRTAQMGLSVTGHNTANANTVGYTRQRLNQQDYFSLNVGRSGNGTMQVGLGTDVASIAQIRDNFLDIQYRQENGKQGFYQTMTDTGYELQTILGELQSDYKLQDVFLDMWGALNQLSTYQPGIDTRGNFISICQEFLSKVQNCYDQSVKYQESLNNQVIDSVSRINDIVSGIKDLNSKIVMNEIGGSRANDFRDQRNALLDELSGYIDIEVACQPDGSVDILTDGNYLLSHGDINKIGLKYTAPSCDFVEPVFTNSSRPLPYDAPPGTYASVINLNQPVNARDNTDKGQLKALLISRGFAPANYAAGTERPDIGSYAGDPLGYRQASQSYFDATQSMIPCFQRQLDTLVNSVVTMINDKFAPNKGDPPMFDAAGAPYNAYGQNNPPFEIFQRAGTPRYTADADGNYIYNQPDPSDPATLYTIKNIALNPALSDTSGSSLLPFSKSGDAEDTALIQELLTQWQQPSIDLMPGGLPLSVQNAYSAIVNNIAAKTNQAQGYLQAQQNLTVQLDSQRQTVSGVSLDEELTKMMTYQYAYSAASRVVSVVNDMLGTLIQRTGRAGL